VLTENQPDSGRVMFFLLITFDEDFDSDALLELPGILSISSSNGEGVLRVAVDRVELLGLLKTSSIVSDKELEEARLELRKFFSISLIVGDGNRFNMGPLSSSE
jgi:hypothetical protein